MENLYLNGYIKKDKLWEALHYAKYNHMLEGVEDRELRAFLEGFNETVAARHTQFKDKITLEEMHDIFEIMRRNHYDIVNERDLQKIGDVLLNEDFRF
jgi:hypothetical protein